MNNHGEPKKMDMKKKSEQGPRGGKMTAHGRLRNCSDQSRRQALSGGFFRTLTFISVTSGAFVRGEINCLPPDR